MAGGLNRPVLPTKGANPDEQRLRSGLGEIVRRFLDSGAFLQRLFPGAIKRVLPSPTGLVSVAEWGTLNRVAPAAEAVVVLPIPRPKTIGVPLAVTKVYPTGVVHIRPTFGADGKTAALLDGSPTGITVATAGRIDLISDGLDWSSGGARVSVADQAAATPSGVFPPTSAWKLPSTYSPIGLWQFESSLTSSSSVVLPALEAEQGVVRYTDIAPGVPAVVVGASGLILRLPHTGTATMMRLYGDISIQMLMQESTEYQYKVGESAPLISFAGKQVNDEKDNYLWSIFQGKSGMLDWFTEVSPSDPVFSYAPNHSPRLPPPAVRNILVGAKRSGNMVQFYLDGKPISTSASGALPTGGGSGLMRIGGDDTTSIVRLPPTSEMVLSSVKITPNAMTDAQFLADYNATLGQVYGTRY